MLLELSDWPLEEGVWPGVKEGVWSGVEEGVWPSVEVGTPLSCSHSDCPYVVSSYDLLSSEAH